MPMTASPRLPWSSPLSQTARYFGFVTMYMANCSHVSFDMSSVIRAPNGELPTTNKPREIAICLSTSALLPPIPRRNIASCREDLEQSRDVHSWVEPPFFSPNPGGGVRDFLVPCWERKKI